MGDFPPEQTKVSSYHTRMTIDRMEMVLFGWNDEKGDHPAWLAGPLLNAPELRDKPKFVLRSLKGNGHDALRSEVVVAGDV